MDAVYNVASQAWNFITMAFVKTHGAWHELYWGDITPGFKEKFFAFFLAACLGFGTAALCYLTSLVVRKLDHTSSLVSIIGTGGTSLFIAAGLVLMPVVGFYIAIGLVGIFVYAVASVALDALRVRKKSY